MMTPNEARRFRHQLNFAIESLGDEIAIQVPILFSEWVVGQQYYGPPVEETDPPQSRIRYGDLLYKCNITHISQADWVPDVAVSLWSRADNPAEEWPEWRQPVGAQDAYEYGAKVSHNGKHWISNTPDNVWEPGVYGWDEVTT